MAVSRQNPSRKMRGGGGQDPAGDRERRFVVALCASVRAAVRQKSRSGQRNAATVRGGGRDDRSSKKRLRSAGTVCTFGTSTDRSARRTRPGLARPPDPL